MLLKKEASLFALFEEIHKPIVKKGHYNESYTVQAIKIDGYSVVDSAIKRGVFGLNNPNTAFVYRAGSDEFSAATASLQDILGEQKVQEQQNNPNKAVITNNQSQRSTQSEDSNNTNSSNMSPAEAKLNHHKDVAPSVDGNPNGSFNEGNNDIQNIVESGQPTNKGAKELQDFMNRTNSQIPQVKRPQEQDTQPQSGKPTNLLNKFYQDDNNKD